MMNAKELRQELGLSVGWVARLGRVTVGRVGAYEQGEPNERLDKVYEALERLLKEVA